jgi:hypothetical protein
MTAVASNIAGTRINTLKRNPSNIPAIAPTIPAIAATMRKTSITRPPSGSHVADMRVPTASTMQAKINF